MLVILQRLSTGAFLFILPPAKHLTTYKDHESPLQTLSVLGWRTARWLPDVLLALPLTAKVTHPLIYP
jgi:hypothetical protein